MKITDNVGFIPKDNLVHGTYYRGHCRNADIARWNGTIERFLYIRTKFGRTHIECLPHPEDDKGWDIFVPCELLVQPNEEIPLQEEDIFYAGG